MASRLTENIAVRPWFYQEWRKKLAVSARSVSGFDVYEALEACSEFIEQFGGHKYAADLRFQEKDYKLSNKRLKNVVSKPSILNY